MAAKTTMKNADVAQAMGQLDTILTEYLVKKAPALPQNIKELVVKIAPWLVIVALVFGVPSFLGLLSLGTAWTNNAYWAAYGMNTPNTLPYYLLIIFTGITLVLQAMAVRGLMARTRQGWNLMYYAALVSAVYSLLSMNWLGLIVGTLINLYFLFQVRSFYR